MTHPTETLAAAWRHIHHHAPTRPEPANYLGAYLLDAITGGV